MVVEKRKVISTVENMVKRANTRREQKLNVPVGEVDAEVERQASLSLDRGRVIGDTQPSGPTTPLS